MELNVLILTVCSALLKVAMVCAQPQYRVCVDPPVDVVLIPDGVTDLQFTLCFRQRDPSSATIMDSENCPLGTVTLPANGPDLPPQTLELGSGTDSLPPEYQLINTIQGGIIGGLNLLVIVNGVSGGTSQQLGFNIANRVGGVPGELDTVTRTISEAGSLTVRFAVTCLPEFTGDMCIAPTTLTEPPTTTTTEEVTMDNITMTMETTTTEEMTMETTTTEEMTMETTTTEEMTTETTIETSPAQVTASSVMDDCQSSSVAALAAGIGGGVAVVLLILCVILTVVLTVLAKRWRRDKNGDSGRLKGVNVTVTPLVRKDSENVDALQLYSVVDKSKKKRKAQPSSNNSALDVDQTGSVFQQAAASNKSGSQQNTKNSEAVYNSLSYSNKNTSSFQGPKEVAAYNTLPHDTGRRDRSTSIQQSAAVQDNTYSALSQSTAAWGGASFKSEPTYSNTKEAITADRSEALVYAELDHNDKSTSSITPVPVNRNSKANFETSSENPAVYSSVAL